MGTLPQRPLSLRNLQAPPQQHKSAQLWRTHSSYSCVRLLRLAGMEPLSWLLLSRLHARAASALHARPALAHAQSLQLRQAAQAGGDLSAELVVGEDSAEASATSAIQACPAQAHAQLIQLRQAAQAGGDLSAELVVEEVPADASTASAPTSAPAHLGTHRLVSAPSLSHARP
jgi:hypothetical protein